MTTVAELASRLAAGKNSSVELVTDCLARIDDPASEGARTFTAIFADEALADAERMDRLRQGGGAPSPFAGIPVSVKCLFDIEGKVTTAGSKVLADAAPATDDAEAIARLRKAGLVVVGHTNMTEFAYSGLGMNPHCGTPGKPADRSRIPGGSSSGAAVSVADGMSALGIGTDTGGSCRIPAAFCGVTGYKPTARRIPTGGTFPLSPTFDSIGSLARSVTCCALADALLAGQTPRLPQPLDVASLKLAVLDNYVLENLTPRVAAAFDAALATLSSAGAQLTRITLKDIERLPELNARGGILGGEAFAIHRDMLNAHEQDYDPRVAVRLRKAEAMEPGEIAALRAIRAEMTARADAITRPFDAVIMPTVAMEAPVFADLDADDGIYGRQNLLALRNTAVGNFLDRCAISLPLPVDGLPVGLMLMGETMGDEKLFDVAMTVERVLAM